MPQQDGAPVAEAERAQELEHVLRASEPRGQDATHLGKDGRRHQTGLARLAGRMRDVQGALARGHGQWGRVAIGFTGRDDAEATGVRDAPQMGCRAQRELGLARRPRVERELYRSAGSTVQDNARRAEARPDRC